MTKEREYLKKNCLKEQIAPVHTVNLTSSGVYIVYVDKIWVKFDSLNSQVSNIYKILNVWMCVSFFVFSLKSK